MRESIYVVTHGSQWKVMCKHCHRNEFHDTQAAAIKSARQHVAMSGEGALAQILIQGANSQFRAEWTYGKDPFPPRG